MLKKGCLSCPKCRSKLSASSKFCEKCGRRIGFGVRSENEIRAAMNKLDNTSFIVKDINIKPQLLSDIGLIQYVLGWTIGEEEIEPTDMLARGLQQDNKIRQKEK